MTQILTAVGCFKAAEPATWTDHEGNEWRTPAGRKLHMARYPLHAALRAYVYRRDNFTCQECGAKGLLMSVEPHQYDGFETLCTDRMSCQGFVAYLVVDHVISRRNGGSNHPTNLQTLCYCCNAAKATLIDKKGAEHGAYSHG